MGKNGHWQTVCINYEGEINNQYTKSKRTQFTKRTNSFLPIIVKGTPFSGALTFYTEVKQSENAA